MFFRSLYSFSLCLALFLSPAVCFALSVQIFNVINEGRYRKATDNGSFMRGRACVLGEVLVEEVLNMALIVKRIDKAGGEGAVCKTDIHRIRVTFPLVFHSNFTTQQCLEMSLF